MSKWLKNKMGYLCFWKEKKLGSRGHCVDFISTASRASMLRDMRSARLKLFCRESSEQDNLQFWTSSNAKYWENEVLFADVATTCCLFAAFHKYLSASEYFYNIFIFCSSANKLFETPQKFVWSVAWIVINVTFFILSEPGCTIWARPGRLMQKTFWWYWW